MSKGGCRQRERASTRLCGGTDQLICAVQSSLEEGDRTEARKVANKEVGSGGKSSLSFG